jgi:hypothetical protein
MILELKTYICRRKTQIIIIIYENDLLQALKKDFGQFWICLPWNSRVYVNILHYFENTKYLTVISGEARGRASCDEQE